MKMTICYDQGYKGNDCKNWNICWVVGEIE